MTSNARTNTLIIKIRDLSQEKLAKVEDLVDLLREKEQPGSQAHSRLRKAVADGRIIPPTSSNRSSSRDKPPSAVPGTALSKTVLEDRR